VFVYIDIQGAWEAGLPEALARVEGDDAGGAMGEDYLSMFPPITVEVRRSTNNGLTNPPTPTVLHGMD
jgi:hypothetical protein